MKRIIKVIILILTVMAGVLGWYFNEFTLNITLEGPEHPVAEYGQAYTFYFGSYIQTDTYLHQGLAYEGFSIRREDLLGNVTVGYRCRFALYRVTAGGCENGENAQWLLEFQRWVQAQSAAGLAPTFGDDPARERIRAEKGRLYQASQPGTGTYTVTLTADYVKHY